MRSRLWFGWLTVGYGYGIWIFGNTSVRVEIVLRLVDGLCLKHGAFADVELRVRLESVLDALGSEEAGVDATVDRGVEFVGTLYTLTLFLVIVGIVLAGIVEDRKSVV